MILDGWFEVLPDLRLIGSIRHPAAVTGSLAARNGFDEAKSLSIWARYNLAMLGWRDRAPFDIIDYDDPDYESRVRRAAGTLGLDALAPMPFRTGELNHQGVRHDTPDAVADLWDRLKATT